MSANPQLTVSVALTSYGRARILERCLAGIAQQEPPADEVIVVHRREDEDTARLLERWRGEDEERHRPVVVSEPGIVAGLQAGTDAARGDVVVFLDDDAVPRDGWLAELLHGFALPGVGGVGGRFVDHIDGRVVEGWTSIVGRITWYGRVIGRHDRDTDYYGDVDLLPGTNMSFRRELIHNDPKLIHSAGGLALGNELDTCLTIRRAGHRLLYSPRAVVDHYTTSYRDPILGSRVVGPDVRASAANYTYALLKYLPATRWAPFLLYAVLVGSSALPGPLRAAVELPVRPRRGWAMIQRIPMAWRGRATGIRMYRDWRRRPPRWD